MKEGRTLSALAAEIDRQGKCKEDIISRQDALEMRIEEKPAEPAALIHIPQLSKALPIRPHAHGQIASRLGIPKLYYDRMIREQPELLARNVNTWLGQGGEVRRMVRTLDGNVRAYLSDKYQRIEHFEVAEVALNVLGEMEMHIRSVEVTEARLYIKAVFPGIREAVKVGDEVCAGVMIRNSEIGLGAFDVTGFAEVLKCTNGMVLPDTRFRRAHIGARADGNDDSFILADDTRKADDTAIMLKARDYIRAAADASVFKLRIEKMRAASGEFIQGDPSKAVEILAKRESFNEAERGGVMRHLVEGGDLSRWGLINAVTRTAADCSSYDRATDLETAGGAMLDMPAGEWREIAQAA